METLYEYLLDNYKENEPIFLVDLQVDGMTRTNVRQQIKKLTDTGKVKRFDNGIYFLPKKTIFKSDSQLAPEKVLELHVKVVDVTNGVERDIWYVFFSGVIIEMKTISAQTIKSNLI